MTEEVKKKEEDIIAGIAEQRISRSDYRLRERARARSVLSRGSRVSARLQFHSRNKTEIKNHVRWPPLATTQGIQFISRARARSSHSQNENHKNGGKIMHRKSEVFRCERKRTQQKNKHQTWPTNDSLFCFIYLVDSILLSLIRLEMRRIASLLHWKIYSTTNICIRDFAFICVQFGWNINNPKKGKIPSWRKTFIILPNICIAADCCCKEKCLLELPFRRFNSFC